jgi:hypothetical protein
MNRFDGNLYERERALNTALVRADLTDGFETYLEIFDAFYADDIEFTGDRPIRGKAKVRSLLFNFLAPLHLMAEVGGLSISVRAVSVHGDAPNQTHSEWTLDLAGVSRATTLRWSTLRKWSGSHVVYERHYDHRQSGGPLTLDDFRSLDTAGANAGR